MLVSNPLSLRESVSVRPRRGRNDYWQFPEENPRYLSRPRHVMLALPCPAQPGLANRATPCLAAPCRPRLAKPPEHVEEASSPYEAL